MEEGIHYSEGWLETNLVSLGQSIVDKIESLLSSVDAVLLGREQDWGLDPEMSTEII
jgi:hypothetical protein